MGPALIIATVLFGGFLLVLALIGFGAYRVTARREGPALGAAGGCALAAVLLGAAFFAFLAFAILIGVMVAQRASESGALRDLAESIRRCDPHVELKVSPYEHHSEEEHWNPEVDDADREPEPPTRPKDVREY